MNKFTILSILLFLNSLSCMASNSKHDDDFGCSLIKFLSSNQCSMIKKMLYSVETCISCPDDDVNNNNIYTEWDRELYFGGTLFCNSKNNVYSINLTSPDCGVCKFVVSELQTDLKEYEVPVKEAVRLVEFICSRLESSQKETCDKITANMEKVLEFIYTKNPQEICEMIGLCR